MHASLQQLYRTTISHLGNTPSVTAVSRPYSIAIASAASARCGMTKQSLTDVALEVEMSEQLGETATPSTDDAACSSVPLLFSDCIMLHGGALGLYCRASCFVVKQ